jgi:hypothetical protein
MPDAFPHGEHDSHRAAIARQTPQRSEAARSHGRRRRRLGRVLVVSILLVVIALIIVQVVAVPLWTAAPDTVQMTVMHHAGNGSAPDVVTTIYDRTVHDAVMARRLQHDLAALPTVPLNSIFSCPGFYNYDTYTLTWSRAGFFVEWASADPPGCATWGDVTLIYHESVHLPRSDTIYVDMHTLLGAPLPLCGKPPEPNCRLGT